MPHRLPLRVSSALVASVWLASGVHAAIPYPAGPYTVEPDRAGFRVDGQYQLLRGGTLQYWRLPPEVWRDRLKRFKAAGFNTVDMYVPWNVIEPQEGQFTFTDPDLTGFLDLCKELGLFVYFRPGPYITNEMDGGGVPAWLAAKATKKTLGADGIPNLRTHDPDYLNYVQRYFSRLNTVIKPYLASQGGPIVLYSIENEYNWFEIFKNIDKAAWYEGGWERSPQEPATTRRYLTALRDMVRADGIDVPITTCPGNGKTTGMGAVPGIIPMPNMYAGLGGGSPEKTAWSLLVGMHDPSRDGGAYTQYPSGTTETDRLPAKLKRLFMGGLDATFAFNIAGTHQEGYRNGVALNIDTVKAIIDPNDKRSLTDKISGIQVGYYHNVIDFNGAISPSGGHRENYYEFRRDNAMIDTLTPVLAPLVHPFRSSTTGYGGDARVAISNPAVGAPEGKHRWHYWWLDPRGTALVGLVNASGQEQVIPVQGVRVLDERLPRYAPMTIPLQVFDGKPQFGDVDLTYAQWLVYRLPLANGGRLHYTTSELMHSHTFSNEHLIVVHGKPGTVGELALDQLPGLSVTARDAGVDIRERSDNRIVITYTHGGVKQLRLAADGGRSVRIVMTEHALAGRTWLLDDQALLIGADYVDEDSLEITDDTIRLTLDHDGSGRELTLISPRGRVLDGPALTTVSAFRPDTQEARYRIAAAAALPVLPDLWTTARSSQDLAEVAAVAPGSGWQSWQGAPQALEQRGILTGHAWYRSTFQWNGPTTGDVGLYVGSASDFVGVYVNGQYLSTVAPMGTEINSGSSRSAYRFASLAPFLKSGENVIAFRTEIWGHGSFMFPRGKLFIVGPSAPALGFDSLKGLRGTARVGNVNLSRWAVRSGLGGERAGIPDTGFDDRQWPAITGPTLPLAKGDVRWVRASFDSADMPDPSRLQAPVALELKGARSKATVYLNGRLIGRWISDDGLFKQGFWASGTRNMWMNTDADHFPIAREALRPAGQRNVLAIAFEDTSPSGSSAGVVDSMRLVYAVENRRFDANGQVTRVPATRWREEISLR